jgi:signal recognition particle receptor subunit beta
MALFNYASKEITLKIVYYGPGLSGKTTNLQFLHSTMDPDRKGKLLSLATEADRTLFFDFMPVTLGKIKDFNVRFQLYTVPGQIRYNATRKLVLKGADAVVFVADSQHDMREQNIESLLNMRENLSANNIDPDDIPVVLQYNKWDLKNIMSAEELDRDLNEDGQHQRLVAVATNGTGVEDTFEAVTGLMLKHISRKHNVDIQPAAPGEAAEAGPQEAERAVERASLRKTLDLSKATAEARAAYGEKEDLQKRKESPETPQEESSGDLSGEAPLLQSLLDVSRAISFAAQEISSEMRNSKVEAMLAELVSVSNSFNSLASELLVELRESRLQQDRILAAIGELEKSVSLGDGREEPKKGFRLFKR